MTLQIYLAGPDVFLPDAKSVGRRKCEMCAEYCFKGLFPLDQELDAPDAAAIFNANHALMQQADIGLFNLTPFRGPSAEAGTVFELGLMFGLGKPVYGYSSDTTNYCSRVYADGYQIEDFGLSDNLMIDKAIEARDGKFVCLSEDGGNALAAFSAFEHALAEMIEDLQRHA